jgi:hypothetical protein
LLCIGRALANEIKLPSKQGGLSKAYYNKTESKPINSSVSRVAYGLLVVTEMFLMWIKVRKQGADRNQED